MPNALVTGVCGQDGAYLTRFLLDKGYTVTGLQRRWSKPNTENLDALDVWCDRFSLVSGDILDPGCCRDVVDRSAPDEVYNLAAMSDVAASFEIPDHTLQVNAIGTTRLLEAIRAQGWPKVRFYQASTSELFGDSHVAQNEDTAMHPMSPYAAAKLAAFWMVRTYRDAYGLHACNGILFNHESKLRADCFVTQKVAKYVAKWNFRGGLAEPLRLGNLNAKRDWSHAADFVRGMWMMLQHDEARDFVLASGETRSVRELVSAAFDVAGDPVEWQNPNRGFIRGRLAVVSDAELFRPLDVPVLCGDATAAHRVLGWRPEIGFTKLLEEMVGAEFDRLRAG